MTLLKVTHLKKEYPIYKGLLRKQTGAVYALNGVSFTLETEKMLAIVGESGSGKTTLGNAIIRLIEPTSGEVWFDGGSFLDLQGNELIKKRLSMQMVFQDPLSSLNPRKTIEQTLTEPLLVHRLVKTAKEAKEKALQALDQVGLTHEVLPRYPHAFSGGQQQRLCIARALLFDPKLLLLDEALSSLDVSYQAQILTLLETLKQTQKISYLFITHDLRVVRHQADWILVLYRGKVVEAGPAKALFDDPRHPYTLSLIDSIPKEHPSIKRKPPKERLEMSSQKEKLEGCPYYQRCPYREKQCLLPPPEQISQNHTWYCIHHRV